MTDTMNVIVLALITLAMALLISGCNVGATYEPLVVEKVYACVDPTWNSPTMCRIKTTNGRRYTVWLLVAEGDRIQRKASGGVGNQWRYGR